MGMAAIVSVMFVISFDKINCTIGGVKRIEDRFIAINIGKKL
jgi:hypothetical protein